MRNTRIPFILLTGRSRIGKTTAIKKIASLLGTRAGGFYSPEVRDNGDRIAFEIVTLDGNRVLFSTKKPDIGFQRELKVGNHRVDLDVIQKIMIPILLDSIKNKEITVIDEIGPMEIISREFREVILDILHSNALVLGTISDPRISFMKRVLSHPRVKTIEVTLENRNRIPMDIFAYITHSLKVHRGDKFEVR